MPTYSKHAAYLPRNHLWVTQRQSGNTFIGIVRIPLSSMHTMPIFFFYTLLFINYCYITSLFFVQTFKRNVNRVRAIISGLVDAKNFWQSLIDWDYPSKSIMAFIVS